KRLKIELTIPGLLFIDTPGHAAFVNLRRRGGNLADIAILVIDINEGVMPQTLECIDILKSYKVPFVVAANKIDLIEGWKYEKSENLLKSIENQTQLAKQRFEVKLYGIVGRLSELGFDADRFDRVSDYTKQIAVVPVSAKTGQGIPELLMVIIGLTQKYLEKGLKVDLSAPAKGTILEVKEEKGLGLALDTIIYDGSLSVGDAVVIGGLEGPILTKVKALLEPEPLAEMRLKKTKFVSVGRVSAATGVKIVVQEGEKVVAGMPLLGVKSSKEIEAAKSAIMEDVGEVLLETSQEGVAIKADSLGSLEALAMLLKEHGIPVKKASIGPISKKDILDAESEKNPLNAAILGFNIPHTEEITSEKVKIIIGDVIYRIVEEYALWKESRKEAIAREALEGLTSPCKIHVLKGYVFRQSNPAVVGVEVLAGTLKPNTPLMKEDGMELTRVKSIQLEQQSIESAARDQRVAIAMSGVTIGRQIKEGDKLWSVLTEEEFKKFKELKHLLKDEEKELLSEIAQIMRKKKPLWGL
ncbi:MAG: translation initiation factor IF-2, partial [Candidatus Woesearchaeota archaeon]